MSNSCNQTLTLSNTAEIAEDERPVHLTPLRWNKFEPLVGLTSHSAGVLKSLKFNPGKNYLKNFTYFFVLAEVIGG